MAKKTREVKEKRETGRSTLRGKMIAAFLLPVVLFVVTGMLIYQKSSQTMTETYTASANTSVITLGEYFDVVLDNVELMATRLSVNSAIGDYYTGTQSQTESKLMNVKMAIKNESIADRYVEHITIITNSGTACNEKGPVTGDIYQSFVDSAEGKYVEENLSENGIWIGTHAAMDEAMQIKSDDYGMSYVRILNNNSNKKIGYIIIDIKKSFIQNILDSAQIGKESIRALVLRDGSQMLSGSDTMIFSDMDFYKEAAAGKEEETSRYVETGEESALFAYNRLRDGMLVCALVPKGEIIAGADSILRFTLFFVIICAVVAIILGIFMTNGISKTLRLVNKILKQTSKGDLTGAIVIRRKDEFADLSENISGMTESMKYLIRKMTHVSHHVSDSAADVQKNSALVIDAAKSITGSAEEINQGIRQQSLDTENCVVQMTELSDKIAEVHKSTGAMNQLTKQTQASIEDGMVIVQNLADKAGDTTKITKTILLDIDALNQESQKINAIIETINGLAKQTNLLSLNASIEAARAGEAGKGFAVVSEEIRVLADQSASAGNQIGAIIHDIQKRMNETTQTAGMAEEIVNVQSKALEETIGVFKKMKEQIVNLGEDVGTISVNVDQIEATKEDTICAIESISEAVSVTEAASLALDESTQILYKATNELDTAVQKLQEDAGDLSTSVAIFKIE